MTDVAAAFNRRGFAVPDDLAARLASVAVASGGPDAAALAFEAYAMDSNIPRGELTAAALTGFEATTKAATAAVAAKRAAFGGLSWDDAADALVDGTNAGLRRSLAAAHTPAAKKGTGVLGGGGRTPGAAAATPAPASAAAAAAAATPAAAGPTPGSAAFARRAGSGEAVATLAPPAGPLAAGPLPPPPRAAAAAPRVEVALVGGEGAAGAAAAAAAPPPPPRLLTDSLADRAAFLEGRIAGFAAAFEAATGAAPSAPVGVALQDERALFVGRVVCETAGSAGGGGGGAAPAAPAAPAGGGRLNAASIVLEGSAALSGGGRARLDVSRLVGPGGPGFRLFPGAAVAVSGACPAGHTLVAAALHASAPAPPAASTPHALARFSAATGAAGMHVLVAAGPYTPPDGDGLDYGPLDAVLAAAAGGGGGGGGGAGRAGAGDGPPGRPADALVLVGPFVDAAHPAWTSPAAPDATFADIFAGQVLPRLAAFADARAAAGAPLPPIVLIPSVRDATGLPTFPQPALPLPAGSPACVHALPNPATFRLNEVVVGATAADPLLALSGCEAGAGPGGGARGDRLAGLASALLEQRCFYPVYPPAAGACLDARRAAGGGGGGRGAGLALGGGVSPDVLLLPSDLAPFARVAAAAVPAPLAAAVKAEGGGGGGGGGGGDAAATGPATVRSVAINPGRCVRPGGGGGTVAWLDVAPAVEVKAGGGGGGGGDDGDDLAMDVEGTGAGAGLRQHAVDGRARVEVVRL